MTLGVASTSKRGFAFWCFVMAISFYCSLLSQLQQAKKQMCWELEVCRLASSVQVFFKTIWSLPYSFRMMVPEGLQKTCQMNESNRSKETRFLKFEHFSGVFALFSFFLISIFFLDIRDLKNVYTLTVIFELLSLLLLFSGILFGLF